MAAFKCINDDTFWQKQQGRSDDAHKDHEGASREEHWADILKAAYDVYLGDLATISVATTQDDQPADDKENAIPAKAAETSPSKRIKAVVATLEAANIAHGLLDSRHNKRSVKNLQETFKQLWCLLAQDSSSVEIAGDGTALDTLADMGFRLLQLLPSDMGVWEGLLVVLLARGAFEAAALLANKALAELNPFSDVFARGLRRALLNGGHWREYRRRGIADSSDLILQHESLVEIPTREIGPCSTWNELLSTLTTLVKSNPRDGPLWSQRVLLAKHQAESSATSSALSSSSMMVASSQVPSEMEDNNQTGGEEEEGTEKKRRVRPQRSVRKRPRTASMSQPLANSAALQGSWDVLATLQRHGQFAERISQLTLIDWPARLLSPQIPLDDKDIAERDGCLFDLAEWICQHAPDSVRSGTHEWAVFVVAILEKGIDDTLVSDSVLAGLDPSESAIVNSLQGSRGILIIPKDPLAVMGVADFYCQANPRNCERLLGEKVDFDCKDGVDFELVVSLLAFLLSHHTLPFQLDSKRRRSLLLSLFKQTLRTGPAHDALLVEILTQALGYLAVGKKGTLTLDESLQLASCAVPRLHDPSLRLQLLQTMYGLPALTKPTMSFNGFFAGATPRKLNEPSHVAALIEYIELLWTENNRLNDGGSETGSEENNDTSSPTWNLQTAIQTLTLINTESPCLATKDKHNGTRARIAALNLNILKAWFRTPLTKCLAVAFPKLYVIDHVDDSSLELRRKLADLRGRLYDEAFAHLASKRTTSPVTTIAWLKQYQRDLKTSLALSCQDAMVVVAKLALVHREIARQCLLAVVAELDTNPTSISSNACSFSPGRWVNKCRRNAKKALMTLPALGRVGQARLMAQVGVECAFALLVVARSDGDYDDFATHFQVTLLEKVQSWISEASEDDIRFMAACCLIQLREHQPEGQSLLLGAVRPEATAIWRQLLSTKLDDEFWRDLLPVLVKPKSLTLATLHVELSEPVNKGTAAELPSFLSGLWWSRWLTQQLIARYIEVLGSDISSFFCELSPFEVLVDRRALLLIILNRLRNLSTQTWHAARLIIKCCRILFDSLQRKTNDADEDTVVREIVYNKAVPDVASLIDEYRARKRVKRPPSISTPQDDLDRSLLPPPDLASPLKSHYHDADDQDEDGDEMDNDHVEKNDDHDEKDDERESAAEQASHAAVEPIEAIVAAEAVIGERVEGSPVDQS